MLDLAAFALLQGRWDYVCGLGRKDSGSERGAHRTTVGQDIAQGVSCRAQMLENEQSFQRGDVCIVVERRGFWFGPAFAQNLLVAHVVVLRLYASR
jgi:hypothetical protein